MDFLLIEVPARYAYPGVPVKRHMLNRCRSEAEKAFVRRLFHHKSYKRNAKRLQEYRSRNAVSSFEKLDNQPIDQGSNISYSSRIFGRNLLITPGPEGRKISFGCLNSVEDSENGLATDMPSHNVTNSSLNGGDLVGYESSPGQAIDMLLHNETGSSSVKAVEEPLRNNECNDEISLVPSSGLETESKKVSLDESGVIDIEFLKLMDLNSIKAKWM